MFLNILNLHTGKHIKDEKEMGASVFLTPLHAVSKISPQVRYSILNVQNFDFLK